MNEERRTASIEIVLVELGKISQTAQDTKATVEELKNRVGFQNGRVGKLERWQAFIQGAGMILVLLVAPIIVQFASRAFAFLTH